MDRFTGGRSPPLNVLPSFFWMIRLISSTTSSGSQFRMIRSIPSIPSFRFFSIAFLDTNSVTSTATGLPARSETTQSGGSPEDGGRTGPKYFSSSLDFIERNNSCTMNFSTMNRSSGVSFGPSKCVAYPRRSDWRIFSRRSVLTEDFPWRAEQTGSAKADRAP